MIGDSDVDVLTARAAGAKAVGCLFGLAVARLRVAGPDVLVDSPGSGWRRFAVCRDLPLQVRREQMQVLHSAALRSKGHWVGYTKFAADSKVRCRLHWGRFVLNALKMAALW